MFAQFAMQLNNGMNGADVHSSSDKLYKEQDVGLVAVSSLSCHSPNPCASRSDQELSRNRQLLKYWDKECCWL